MFILLDKSIGGHNSTYLCLVVNDKNSNTYINRDMKINRLNICID